MSSMVLDGASPRSRSTDPVTSVDAGRAANLSESQSAVLAAFSLVDFGLTQGELETRVDGWSPSRIRSAVSELVTAGRLMPMPDTFRATKYGRKARVYMVVSSG